MHLRPINKPYDHRKRKERIPRGSDSTTIRSLPSNDRANASPAGKCRQLLQKKKNFLSKKNKKIFLLTRFCWMLCDVENEDIAARCFRRDDVRILRHVSCTIHFSFMIHLHFVFDPSGDAAEASEFSAIRVVMRSIKLRVVVRQLDGSDNQMILFIRRMRTQNQSMNSIIFSFWSRKEKISSTFF